MTRTIPRPGVPLGLALALIAMLGVAGIAPSRARQDDKAPSERLSDEWRRAAQDEIDVATARVEGKRAEVRLAQSRLGQVQAIVASTERLLKRNMVPESSVALARLDEAEHQARLDMRNAELKEREIRLAALKRADGPRSATGPGLLEDLRLRLDAAERRIEELEAKNLEQQRAIYSRPR